MIMKKESLRKLADAFSNFEETQTFMNDVFNLTEELHFTQLMVKHVDGENVTNLFLKQICIITIFFREHMELIREFIQRLEFQNISEEELKKMKE